MVERRIELDRRYMRKDKMFKLKKKLGTALGADREKILYKIKRLSPWWTEDCLKQAEAAKGTAPVVAAKPKVEKEKKSTRAPAPRAKKA